MSLTKSTGLLASTFESPGCDEATARDDIRHAAKASPNKKCQAGSSGARCIAFPLARIGVVYRPGVQAIISVGGSESGDRQRQGQSICQFLLSAAANASR